jgi:hypothetical protein
MSHRALWDGREPITHAMDRWDLRDAFQEAVDEKDRAEAVRILCAVGADDETAWHMVAVLISDDGCDDR